MKPVGRHFRLPGHETHSDLVMLPVEIVSARDTFLLRARETLISGHRELFSIWFHFCLVSRGHNLFSFRADDGSRRGFLNIY